MPTIDSYHLSDPGQKRTNNEDAVGAFEPKDSRQLRQSGRLYVVADGLGGHAKGEQASQLVVDSLLKFYYEAPEIPPEKRIRDIVQQVNQKLIAARQDMASGEKTATTVVTAVIRNGDLLVANVGDSRAYLIRDGKVYQLTNDHSFVGEMMRAGAITEAEAQQSKYRNRLTRSVGGGDSNSVEVEFYKPIPLSPGDLILLCTDGLTQYATHEDLLAATSYGTTQEMAERLIRFANARGGSDNITVLVIKYGKKSRLPANLPIKTLALAGAGLVGLFILGLLGWYVFFGRSAPLTSTPTPTASLTQTAPPPTAIELPASLTPSPTETFTPEPPTASPAPASTLVDCIYTVQPGDTLSEITAKFKTNVENVFRGDTPILDPNTIQSGEELTIKNITSDVCIPGGGTLKQ